MDIKKPSEKINVEIVKDTKSLNIDNNCAIYISTSEENYHKASVKGIAIYNKTISKYIPIEYLSNLDFIKGNIYTYDNKKNYVSLNKYNISINNVIMDVMIAGYLLNYNIKEDVFHKTLLYKN